MERVEHRDRLFAIVFRKDFQADKSTFLTPSESSLQVGFIVHKKGYIEVPHTHKPMERIIRDLQQMLFIEKGIVEVDFFSDRCEKIKTVKLEEGDTILIMNGAHSIRVLEDLRCLTVKQGPFLGAEEDKIDIGEKL